MIYLDHQATTPIDPLVLEAMMPVLATEYGNAASQHRAGDVARRAVEAAREQLAQLVAAQPQEICFTSGATESNNLALKGTLGFGARGHLVVGATEHRSVLDAAGWLESRGVELTVIPVDGRGHLDLDALAAAIRDDTSVVSVMAVNNEIGTVTDLEAVAERVHRREDVLFHCDATQAVGKLPFKVDESGIDLLSLSAHKLYGPKGVGALWIRRRIRDRVQPLVHGGGHERGMRSGTLNVAGCVGLGVAAQVAGEKMAAEGIRLRCLGQRLLDRLGVHGVRVALVGDPVAERLPGNLSLQVQGVEADDLLLAVPEVAMSTGSACSSAAMEPSHVLLAIGLGVVGARECIRLGVGRFSSEADVDRAAELLARGVRTLRAAVDPVLSRSGV